MNRLPLTPCLVATLLFGCGDGRHFDDERSTSDPGGGSGGASTASSDTPAGVTGGNLEMGQTWGEGLQVEVSGLRWSDTGEIELLLGAVDPVTHTAVGALGDDAFSFAEDGQGLGAEVLFDVQREQNLRVAVVLDLSRSMSASNAVEPLQQAARGLMDAVPSGSKLALVRFATTYELVQDFTGDLAALSSDVEALTPNEDRTGQFTNLWGALTYAGSLFDGGTAGEGRVVVAFTDGRDNVAEADAAAAKAALTEAGALVYAVGLGQELDRDALKALAGETRYAETARPAALGPLFNDIGQRLGQLVRLHYTTPKMHGQHTLAVTVDAGNGRRAGFDVAFTME